jgi:hypothetical protein
VLGLLVLPLVGTSDHSFDALPGLIAGRKREGQGQNWPWPDIRMWFRSRRAALGRRICSPSAKRRDHVAGIGSPLGYKKNSSIRRPIIDSRGSPRASDAARFRSTYLRSSSAIRITSRAAFAASRRTLLPPSFGSIETEFQSLVRLRMSSEISFVSPALRPTRRTIRWICRLPIPRSIALSKCLRNSCSSFGRHLHPDCAPPGADCCVRPIHIPEGQSTKLIRGQPGFDEAENHESLARGFAS